MRYYKISLMIAVIVFLSSCALFKTTNHKKAVVSNQTPSVANVDSAKAKSDKSKTALKPYEEVISAHAVTRRGLFTIHKIDDRYFFEIPDRILDKDILLVSRIEQGAADGQQDGIGYGGDQIGQSEIEFSRGPGNKLFIRLRSYNARSTDSSVNGMYRTVQASNLQPIQAAFDIKTIGSDSGTFVIDVTDFLNSDNPLLYFDAQGKKVLNLGGYQRERSYISDIQAFPLNVELHTVTTYLKAELPATYALNVSFVLLPESLMRPRYFDKRIGYFYRGYINYDAPEGVDVTNMITRWRLEPKEEDKERYLKGELVEPKKPIIYYIDPATPKKWVSYLIQGVNDWQRAFEKAGFKNAIYALEAPTNDSTFSLLDARHNAIIYKASHIPNASGPHVHDPRTGEILETHVNWYHNLQSLVHDWYMIQAGPNDPGAQKMIFDDSLMGELIRFVSSHEVGHTLGLRHNMGASSTVPTDSLRSKSYLAENGFCPSIMDYARFNYVAQPEDGLAREDLMPRIGVYDEWAIEWGYRWFPDFKNQEEEIVYMDKWINSRLSKDKRLWWGEGEAGPFIIVADPRVQTEDLGDDQMKANSYGIKNLKRVMDNLETWTISPHKDYQGLKRLYKGVEDQYNRYIMHVANNIGNKYSTSKMASQEGPVITFIPRSVQKKAMQFLAAELFDTPNWLYDKEIFSLIGGPGDYAFLETQKKVIHWLVSYSNYLTMSWAQMQQPEDVYSFKEFLNDMETEIWKELDTRRPVSFRRRNLQKVYSERIIQMSIPSYNIPGGASISEKLMYDFYPIFQKHLRSIIGKIDKQLPYYKDEATILHLREVRKRLEEPLHFQRFAQPLTTNTNSIAPNSYTSIDEMTGCSPLETNSRPASMKLEQELGKFWLPCFYNHLPNQK